MFDLKKIRSNCFWEYNFSDEELLDIAKNGEKAEKAFLFSKIFEHSTDVLNDLDIFSVDDKQALLKRYFPGGFNKPFLQKRYDVLRHFILGESTCIKELEWRI